MGSQSSNHWDTNYKSHRGGSLSSVRVYCECLSPAIAYRTVRVNWNTTSFSTIRGLLEKYKLTHVDPSLFYLSLEVTLSPQHTSVISLSPQEKLLEVLHCSPWKECT